MDGVEVQVQEPEHAQQPLQRQPSHQSQQSQQPSQQQSQQPSQPLSQRQHQQRSVSTGRGSSSSDKQRMSSLTTKVFELRPPMSITVEGASSTAPTSKSATDEDAGGYLDGYLSGPIGATTPNPTQSYSYPDCDESSLGGLGVEEKDDEDSKQQVNRFRVICCVALVAMLFGITGGIATLLISIDGGNGGSASSNEDVDAGQGSGGGNAPPTLSPTASPTASPVVQLVPTESPTTSPVEDQQQQTPQPTAGSFTNEPTGPAAATPVPTEMPSTSQPTSSPTLSPATIQYEELLDFIIDKQGGQPPSNDPQSPEQMALSFLIDQDGGVTLEVAWQRYLLLVLENTFLLDASTSVPASTLSLRHAGQRRSLADAPTTIAVKKVAECNWAGVSCNQDGHITELRFGARGLTGSIPSHIKYLTHLTRLELNDNNLQQAIPEDLYDLLELKHLILYNNNLMGTLSEAIAQTQKLERVYLNGNNFSGNIPQGLKSPPGQPRPLEYLNLYNNDFNGPIPNGLELPNLVFFDVGRNQLGGWLPNDLADSSTSLRYLHLDHNKFVGTFPTNYVNIGNGGLITLTFNDNKLSGDPPKNFPTQSSLVQLTMQNNLFTTKLDKKVCELSTKGSIVEFEADCLICDCRELCGQCSAK